MSRAVNGVRQTGTVHHTHYMNLIDARVHNFHEHYIIMYQLVFESMKDSQDIVRYMRITRALGFELIQVESSSGAVTTKELDANYNKSGENVVLVGLISYCGDAKKITFSLPPLYSIWNIYKGERAIVYINESSAALTFDWGRRAKRGGATVTATQLTKPEAELMMSQGTWTPESFFDPGVKFTMCITDRSLKEQISVEALLSLT